MSGKSYAQHAKETFESDKEIIQPEYCHNLITQTQPDPSQSKQYNASDAMIMARLIDNLNNKITIEGASFAQHCLLNKGIKVFKQKARDASMKEMNQLHHPNCFTPILVAEMSPTERKKAQQALRLHSYPSAQMA
jgi:hypothetical protein